MDLQDNGNVSACVPSGHFCLVGTIDGVPSYAESCKAETYHLDIAPFRDAAASQTFFRPVKRAIARKITTGTRALIITFLYRAYGV